MPPPLEPRDRNPSFLDPVEEILAGAFEEFGEDWDRATDVLCSRHPEHADSIRWRIEAMRGSLPVAPADAGEAEMPDRLGPYRLLARLGAGGMGVVYLAEQEQPFRRRVAIKVIRSGMDHARMLARFEQERHSLSLLNHSGIARILDAGTAEDGRLYLAMEYVEGVPLTRYCDEHRLGLRQRLVLLREVCLAVQHAHQKGVIHRDLKPDNILVAEEEGRVLPKIIDFGLARIIDPLGSEMRFTQAGTLLGTPEYMSPEQAVADGPGIDVRTDVYSLGVILYELLTGSLPVDLSEARERGVLALSDRIAHSEPEIPSRRLGSAADLAEQAQRLSERSPARLPRLLHGDLDWITMRALAKDVRDRYPSAQSLADDLQNHLENLPVSAGPPSTTYRLRKFAARHRTLVASAAALLVSLAAGLVISLDFYFEARAARQVAEQRALEAGFATRFMVDVFAAANPYRSAGEAVPVGMMLQQGIHRLRTGFPGNLAVRATLARALSEIYLALGSFDRAEELLDEADDSFATRLLRARAHLARETPDVAGEFAELVAELGDQPGVPGDLQVQAVAGLGLARASGGDHRGAVQTFRRALSIYRREGLEDTPLQAGIRRALAGALWDGGDPQAARREFDRLLQDLAEIYPQGHPQTALTMREYADLLAALGATENAVAMADNALRMTRTMFGDDHLAFAEALLKYSNVCLDAGRLGEVEPSLLRALEIYRESLGEEHSQVAWALNDLGMLYFSQARLAEAEPLLARAQAICERKHHPFTDLVKANHGAVLAELGRTAEGEALLRQAVEAFEVDAVGNAEWLAEARLKLARLLLRKGDAPACLEVAAKVGGGEDLSAWIRGKAWATVAFARNLSGRPADARKAAEEALHHLQSRQSRDDLEIAAALWQLGFSWLQQGDLESGEPPARQALAMLQRLFPGGHPWMVYPAMSLGALLPGERRAEAVELLRLAVREARRFLPADSEYRFQGLLVLVRRLLEAGETGEAELVLAEAQELLPAFPEGHPVRGRVSELRQRLARMRRDGAGK